MAASQTIAEAVENSLNAIHIISKKEFEKANFDQTVKCKIIDNSYRDSGQYKVSDGTSVFLAYSDRKDFDKNDLVWVTIPLGDYSEQKRIVGRYLDDSIDDYTYQNPEYSYIDITGNLIENFNEEIGLVANGNTQEIVLWTMEATNFQGYDRLEIKGRFKTLLKSFNVRTGNYGLRLDIRTKNLGTSQAPIGQKFYSLTFDSDEFFGDVYNFDGYFIQSKVIDISLIENIDAISLVFYQRKNFSIGDNSEPLQYLDMSGNQVEVNPNLFVTDPYISLGYNRDNFTEETLLLYTLDPVTYLSFLTEEKKEEIFKSFPTEEQGAEFIKKIETYDEAYYKVLNLLNKKNMFLRWVHFPEEEGKPVVIDDKTDPDYTAIEKENKGIPEIHWYQYFLEENVTDELAGNFWKEINPNDVIFPFGYRNFYPYIGDVTEDKKNVHAFEKFKVITEYPSRAAKGEEVFNSGIIQGEWDNKNKIWQIKGLKGKLQEAQYWDSLSPDEQTKIESMSDGEKEDGTKKDFHIENYYLWVKDCQKIIQELKIKALNTSDGDWVDKWNEIYNQYKEALRKRMEEELIIRRTELEEKYNEETEEVEQTEIPQEIALVDFNNFLKDEESLEDRETVLDFSNALFDDIKNEYKTKLENIRIEAKNKYLIYEEVDNQISKILAEVKYYYSNELEFTCENEVANNLNMQLVQGLSLEVDKDGLNGNYKIYNNEGDILNPKESQKRRIISAKWNSIVTGEKSLDGFEKIRWYIPIENTMIEYPQEGIEYGNYVRYNIEPENSWLFVEKVAEKALYTYDYNTETKEYEYREVTLNQSYSSTTSYYIKSEVKTLSRSADYPGYFCIERKGRSFEEHEPGTEEATISEQIFRIKKYYSQNLINNTIKCIVYKNGDQYPIEATLNFGPTGTSGTDYTFELAVDQGLPAVLTVYSEKETQPSTLTIIPHLWNYENKDVIEEYKNSLAYSWWSVLDSDAEKIIITYNQENNKRGKCLLTVNTNDIEEAQYYILKASIRVPFQGDKHITLTAYKPIAVRASEIYTAIDGADQISYDSAGVNPSYYKDPYQIYTYDFGNHKTVPVEDAYWEMSFGKDTGGFLANTNEDKEKLKNFYPQIINNKLFVPSYYLRDNGRQIAVNCYRDLLKPNEQGEIKREKTLVWSQPLYIYQNSYTSTLLNSWDGKLTIDEENGTILSTAVGAGAKDDENRFNGVIMGDLSGIDKTPVFGLYGYNEGQQSFGFKVDGTAFIGKSGRGQINFDGNSGTISSLSYNISEKENKQGMLIDLDDGFIDIYGSNIRDVSILKDGEVTASVRDALKLKRANLLSQKATIETEKQKYHQYKDRVEITKLDLSLEPIKKQLQAINKFFGTENITSERDFDLAVNELLPGDDNNRALRILQDNQIAYLINDGKDFQINYNDDNKNFNGHVRVSATDPYFVVTSRNRKNLINVGINNYFLQTDNFILAEEDNEFVTDTSFISNFEQSEDEDKKHGQGMLFDLSHGYLLGYNFKLKSTNTSNSPNRGSYFELNSSGSPFFKVHLETTEIENLCDAEKEYLIENQKLFEKDLIEIANSEFYLQSFNYFPTKWKTDGLSEYDTGEVDTVGAGVRLDLYRGKLLGHDFEISAISPDKPSPPTEGKNYYTNYGGSYIRLNSSGRPFFKIHYVKKVGHGSENSQIAYVDDNAVDENGLKLNRNIDLINISDINFEIQSKDFQRPDGTNTVGKGIRFNLEGDKTLALKTATPIPGSFIEAYSFGLEAYKPGLIKQNSSQKIVINSAATGMPLSKDKYNVFVADQDYLLTHDDETESSIQSKIENFLKDYPNATINDFNNNTDAGLKGKVKVISGYLYDDPLVLGDLFSVSWSGRARMNYLIAESGGKIGPFIISSKALYSNNGHLANKQGFYDRDGKPVREPKPHGVYLGRDGLSVRDKFVVYKNPINRKTKDNLSDQVILTDKTIATDDGIRDFVQSGDYTGVNLSDYFDFEDAVAYDQTFKTSASGEPLALGDLSFYLNGNSVLNGVTAINGNSYIFGNLQIGEQKEIEEIGDEKVTSNRFIAYANTTIFGLFKSTGKAYIGDNDRRWENTISSLRNNTRETLDVFNLSTNNAGLGFVVYRNSYITGYLKVAGSMVVGDANLPNNQTNSNFSNYDGQNLQGDFTAYVKNGKFFGDLEVGAGFVAGTLNEDEPVGTLPSVPFINSDYKTEQKNGSGIQSKYIFLGRSPKMYPSSTGKNKNKTPEQNQSQLQIYANTEQWGNFSAGRFGKTVELYACANAETTGFNPKTPGTAFIKLNSKGVQIQTGAAGTNGQSFHVTSNGGDIILDGRDSSEVTVDGAPRGGNIHLYAGNGKELSLERGNEYVKINTNGHLDISSQGAISMVIRDALTNTNTHTFSIKSGEGIKLTGPHGGLIISTDGNFTLKSEGTLGTSSVEGTNGEIKLTGKKATINATNTYISGTVDISGTATIQADTDISGNTKISGNCYITGSVFAANLKFDEKGVSMGNYAGAANGEKPSYNTGNDSYGGSFGGSGQIIDGWSITAEGLVSKKAPLIKLLPGFGTGQSEILIGSGSIYESGNVLIINDTKVVLTQGGSTNYPLLVQAGSINIGSTSFDVQTGGKLYFGTGREGNRTDYSIDTSGNAELNSINLNSLKLTNSGGELSIQNGTAAAKTLGELAFADDIKKKFNVTNSGQTTVTLYSAVNFQVHDNDFQYRQFPSQARDTFEVETLEEDYSITWKFEPASDNRMYVEKWYPNGTYDAYFTTTGVHTVKELHLKTSSKKYYLMATISEASTTRGAQSETYTVNWSQDNTSNEITFEPTTGTASDTITLGENDFSNPTIRLSHLYKI